MSVRWKPSSWGVVKSTVYSDMLTCQSANAASVLNPGMLRAKSRACQGLIQAYTLLPSVALVGRLFALTQELMLACLTEDWGSSLAEEVTEHTCVEKSPERGYPCIIPAGSRTAALVLLHPLLPSGSWVGGSFSERGGSVPWRKSQLLPALSS